MASIYQLPTINADTNAGTGAMSGAAQSFSHAGTIFGDLRKQILDQEQRALDNAFREQQFRENVRQFDANYGLTKARDEESARHNKQTEINARYATDVGAQSARYAADRSYASHLDAISLQAKIADQLRAQQAASDKAAWDVFVNGSPELAQQQKAQALSTSQSNIDKLKRERDELANLGAEREKLAQELYTNQGLTQEQRDALGARYNAITNKIPDLPALLANKDREIRHKEIENATFTGRGKTDAEMLAAAASAGVNAGGVMPSFVNDFAKQNLQNKGMQDIILAREKALLSNQHEIAKAAINQGIKDASGQTAQGAAEAYDPGYRQGVATLLQKMMNYAEANGKRLDANAAKDIFNLAFGVTPEIIPMPWSPNKNLEPGMFSWALNDLALEDIAHSSDPRIKQLREAILGLSKTRNIYTTPTANGKAENKNNK